MSTNAQLAADPTAKGTIIDDDTAPTVDDVEITSTPVLETDTYGAGETIEVTVTFSEAVTVTGAPHVEYNFGGTAFEFPYESGSDTTALVFAYTVAPGDEDDNGIFKREDGLKVGTGEAIVSAAGVAADVDYAAGGQGERDHKVDGSRSIVSVAVTSTPVLETDTYGAGETIRFRVTFNVAVDVDGDPVFTFALDGGESRSAAHETGGGTTALVFGYTVVSGDTDANGIFLWDEQDFDNPDGPVRLDTGDEIEFKDTSIDVPLYWQGRGTQSGHKVDGSRTTGNNPPSFTSLATFDAAEIQTAAGTVEATDSDSDDSVTGYEITGGADQALFEIAASTGELTFKSAPNYEDPQDSGTDNVHEVTVQATSGTGTRVMTADQTITVTVTNVDEGQSGTVAIDDTTPTVGDELTASTANAADPDGLPDPFAPAWKWYRTPDGGSETEISGAASATYTVVEADLGATLTAKASWTDEGGFPNTLASAPTSAVAAASDTAPVWSTTMTVGNTGLLKNGYNASSMAGMLDDDDFEYGSPAVNYTVQLIDVATQSVLFLVDTNGLPTTDTLTFELGGHAFPFSLRGTGSGPRQWVWTTPDDLDDPNTDIPVGATATLCLRTATQTCPMGRIDLPAVLPTLSIADANADEGAAVEFTVTLSEAAAAEVTVAVATSVETGDTATSGTDFTAKTETLPFAAGETSKTVTVATTEDSTVEENETFTVTLSNPSSNAQLAADPTAKGTIDNDDWPPLAWSTTLTVGNHAFTSHFYGYIQRATGSLTDEDFEFGSDSYVVTVVAVSTEGTVVLYLDRIGLPTEEFMTLQIDEHEFPFADRTSESTGAVWVWDAPADLLDPATTFPVGSTATVCLRSEGQMCPTPAPPDSAPTFTSSATFDAAENQTAAGTVVATDSDAGDDVTGYAITVRAITLGTDQGAFSIGATDGVLTFKTAPNFEDPHDSDFENDYRVEVTATSGTGTREKSATQVITVTVTDVGDEAPGKPAAPDVAAASATSLTVSWSAPANAGPAIDDYDVRYREGTSGNWTDGTHTGTAVTATLTGLSENTSYQVQVRATNDDGTGAWSDAGSGATDANVAPSFSSDAALEAAENQTAAGTVEAADSDSDDEITGYAITGGADQALFEIGATDGELTFKTAPNFEDPKDTDTGNDYVVEVQVTSGTGTREKTATQTITVTVTNADEGQSGTVAIDDTTPTVGDELTASTANAADPDGLPDPFAPAWKWYRTPDGGSETEISGETSATYTVVEADLGATLTAKASWTDVGGYANTLASAATSPVAAASALPTLSIADAEGDEDDGVEFTATLTAAAAADVTATWTASIESGDTASAADLATTKTGPVTVTAGDVEAKFTVPVNDDTTDEPDQTFTVTLSGVSSNAQLAADPTAKGTIIDDDTAPTVDDVEITSTPVLETDTYGAGETIEVTVTFSEAVTVTGAPHVEYNFGGTAFEFPYESGSDTTALVFAYTVAPGDEDDNGIFKREDGLKVGTGEAIVSAAGVAADVDYAAGGQGERDHKVDGSRSIVSVAVTSTPVLETDTYGAGETIRFRVTFNVDGGRGRGPGLRRSRSTAGSRDRPPTRRAAAARPRWSSATRWSRATPTRTAFTCGTNRTSTDPDGPVRLDSDDEIEFENTSIDVPLYWAGRGTQSGPQGGRLADDGQQPAVTSRLRRPSRRRRTRPRRARWRRATAMRTTASRATRSPAARTRPCSRLARPPAS